MDTYIHENFIYILTHLAPRSLAALLCDSTQSQKLQTPHDTLAQETSQRLRGLGLDFPVVVQVAQLCLPLQLHRLQHTRLSCPSPRPRVCSNSCPLSWWCHPTISSSVTRVSFCLQSFPALRSFPMNRLFASGDQSIVASGSASALFWFPSVHLMACSHFQTVHW